MVGVLVAVAVGALLVRVAEALGLVTVLVAVGAVVGNHTVLVAVTVAVTVLVAVIVCVGQRCAAGDAPLEANRLPTATSTTVITVTTEARAVRPALA
jgi:hypothetical protein